MTVWYILLAGQALYQGADTMATVAYLRVSTDEQAQSGLGLEAQLAAITKAVGVPTAVYQDAGLSGSNPRRPGLLGALAALGRGDTLVVAKRDRLARDSFLAAWIDKECLRRGARVASVAGEGTDGDGPADVLMRRMVDAFAEYERAIIGARTAAAMASLRRQGRHTGGDIPFGYRLADDGQHLVADAAEQEVLMLVRRLREQGLSLRAIGAELERRGVISRKGGTAWHPQVVKQLLAQKTDAGTVRDAA
jgi:DNA invertase Pin-like site-specific DNA recombinase